ncbi:MAG TPA: hypothetical protein PLN52_15060 [Opitutaceae bacterium]|nr:hypothetical protein [Opitutaceae bacterium]
MSNLSPPLPADEGRRANSATAGFIFQWWLTLVAWLELTENDALYIEAAEDFDIVSVASATAVQAKSGTSKPLTLRSDAVAKCIDHVWKLRHDSRKPQVVLLSRAAIAEEGGSPFGAGIKGIDLWRLVLEKYDDTSAKAICAFLRGDGTLHAKLFPALVDFLHAASDEEIEQEIILRTRFDTETRDATTLRQFVEDRLIVLGAERHNATVAEAVAIAEKLFSIVVHHAASKHMIGLTRAGLLREIERCVVGNRTALGLSAPFSIPGASSGGASWTLAGAEAGLPSVPERIAGRSSIVTDFALPVASGKGLILTGSSGMGKSTLAKLIAQSVGGKWFWLDLQGCAPEAIQSCVRQFISFADRNRGAAICVVVDGLNIDSLSEAAKNSLRAAMRLVRARRGAVMVTSQRALSLVSCASLGLADAAMREVPRMEVEEIAGLLNTLSCPNPELNLAWATLIHVTTDGHPQLIHASCLWLYQKNWPPFDATAFQEATASLETERSQARRLVSKVSNEEMELLLRLDVLGANFRREHVLAVAEKVERVPGAAFKFDSLLGPWIEPAHARGYFRMSPLLGEIARDMSASRRQALEVACAEARLEVQPVYHNDACLALRHAFSAKHRGLALQTTYKLLILRGALRSASYRHLTWALLTTDQAIAEVAAGDAVFTACFRILRMQVAGELLPSTLNVHYQSAKVAIGHLPAELAPAVRYALATEVLQWSLSSLPAIEWLGLLESLGELAAQVPELIGIGDLFQDTTVPPPIRQAGLADRQRAGLAGLIIHRNKGRAFLNGWLRAMDTLEPKRRSPLIQAFAVWPSLLMLAFDEVWLGESKVESPNWIETLGWYDEMALLVKGWDSEPFAVAIARSASIVQNEYCGDRTRATALLTPISASLPPYLAAVHDQYAKIAAEAQDYATALAHIDVALANWEDYELAMPGKILAIQRAGVWASKERSWQRSAGYFDEGAALSRKHGTIEQSAGFHCDAAIACWGAGEKSKAIQAFDEALELCAQTGDTRNNLAAFQIQKILCYVIYYLASANRGPRNSSNLAAIYPGMGSNPDLNESLKSTPTPRLVTAKTFLATLEFDHWLGDTIWDKYSREIVEAPYLSARPFGIELAIRRSIASGAVAELPGLTARYASVMNAMRKSGVTQSIKDIANGDTATFEPVFGDFNEAFGSSVFVSGLVAIVANEGDVAAAARLLEKRADESPFPRELRSWVQEVIRIAELPFEEFQAKAQLREDAFPEGRLAMDIVLLSKPLIQPELLWRAMYHVALYLYGSTMWGADALVTLDEFAGRRWRSAIERRHEFKNPTLWLPEVRSICSHPVTGTRRICSILIAVAPALSLGEAKDILAQVKAIRDGVTSSNWDRMTPRRVQR